MNQQAYEALRLRAMQRIAEKAAIQASSQSTDEWITFDTVEAAMVFLRSAAP